MYRITRTDGTVLGIVEKVNYIKIGESGSYTTATQKDAIGVAYRGEAYNFADFNEIPDAARVVITEIDAGEVFEQYATFDDLAAAYSEGVQEA